MLLGRWPGCTAPPAWTPASPPHWTRDPLFPAAWQEMSSERGLCGLQTAHPRFRQKVGGRRGGPNHICPHPSEKRCFYSNPPSRFLLSSLERTGACGHSWPQESLGKREQDDHDWLRPRISNIFYNGLERKCFRLWGPQSLLQLLNSPWPCEIGHRHMSKWVWLCSNKTLLTFTLENHIMLMCHKTFFDFFQPFKKISKTILAHGSHKTRRQPCLALGW